MWKIFTILYSRFLVCLTLFVSVCMTLIRAENCSHDELVKCAQPLQLLQPLESNGGILKRDDFSKLCPDLFSGLHCIRSYTRRCMTLHQRNNFHKLYHGTSQLIKDLCHEGKQQDEFIHHAHCLRSARSEYEICSKQYQETIATVQMDQRTSIAFSNGTTQSSIDIEQNNRRTVCCSFIEYLECSENTAKRTCGAETGRYTKHFLKRMSNTLISMYCHEFIENGMCTPVDSGGAKFSTSIFAIIPIVFYTSRLY